MRPEPAALGAVSSSLANGQADLLTAHIRKTAARLGYELLDIDDTDTIAHLAPRIRELDVDAVITPTEEHLALGPIARMCEVITLSPRAIRYRDGHYELLDRGDDDEGSRGAGPIPSVSLPGPSTPRSPVTRPAR